MSDERDLEVQNMKDEHFARIRDNEVFMVEQTSDGRWRIEHWTHDGIAPQSSYNDQYDAAARLLQLMGIKRPVHPQDWPESFCVGSVST